MVFKKTGTELKLFSSLQKKKSTYSWASTLWRSETNNARKLKKTHEQKRETNKKMKLTICEACYSVLCVWLCSNRLHQFKGQQHRMHTTKYHICSNSWKTNFQDTANGTRRRSFLVVSTWSAAHQHSSMHRLLLIPEIVGDSTENASTMFPNETGAWSSTWCTLWVCVCVCVH